MLWSRTKRSSGERFWSLITGPEKIFEARIGERVVFETSRQCLVAIDPRRRSSRKVFVPPNKNPRPTTFPWRQSFKIRRMTS